jgi:U3 small nucleolar RNA-associated protein 14
MKQTPFAGGEEASQQELIARAFAGDDVAAEFESEKEAEAEKEGPKIEFPSQLPGWGAWASLQKEPRWLAAAKIKAEK